MRKAIFLTRVLTAYIQQQNKNCPHCGSPQTLGVGRRNVLLELRRCPSCRLMFRWPKETAEFTRAFYQKSYSEPTVTDLPTPEQVEAMKRSHFAGTEHDCREKVSLLKSVVAGGRVLDFGASWGYTTYQLKLAGYEAEGYEISKPRAAFGRKHLGVTIFDDPTTLNQQKERYDAIYTSHVLEHFPSLEGVFEQLYRLLKPRGSLLIFVPNCGGANARRYGANWGPMICEKHPLALSRSFLELALTRARFRRVIFASNPYGAATFAQLNQKRSFPTDPDGDELMTYAEKGD